MKPIAFLLTVALITLSLFCFAQDKANQSSPTLDDTNLRIATLLSIPESEEVPIDSAVLHFKHRGYERAIYPSRAAAGSNSSIDSRASFYVSPLVMIESGEVGNQLNDVRVDNQSIVKIKLKITLMDDELKQAAADALNRNGIASKVTPDRITVLPYRYIELSCKSQERLVMLASYPDLTAGEMVIPADRPNSLTFSVSGPIDFLKSLEDPDALLAAKFFVSGFEVRKDVVVANLKNFHDLVAEAVKEGEAGGQLNYDSEGSSAGAGISVLGVHLGGTGTQGSNSISSSLWVTRRQLNALAKKSFQSIDLSSWIDLQGDAAAQGKIVDLALQQIFDRCAEHKANIERVDNGFAINDAELQNDLKPTVIAALNASISAEALKRQKGEQSESETPDIKWTADEKGTIAIPQTISVYNLSKADIQQFASFSTTQVRVIAKRVQEYYQGAVIRHSVMGLIQWTENETQTRYLETFFRHEPPRTSVVVSSEPNRGDMHEDDIERDCIPFDPTRYANLKDLGEIAHGDSWNDTLNPSKYGLPAINRQWPRIMDDEHWNLQSYTDTVPVAHSKPGIIYTYTPGD